MRTPLPIDDQIDRLRTYVRTLRADMNRASREMNAQWRKRKVAPFAESLRWERYRRASELAEIAEECLDELKRARAIGLGEFRPGDAINFEVTMKGCERSLERYVIYEVDLLGKEFGERAPV